MVHYAYNDHGQIDTIQKNNQRIAKYEYNARNEITRLTQGNVITEKTYTDMGRVLTQKTTKDNAVVFEGTYTYDLNDNVIKEVIDGKENTYKYDAYDELVESHKYIDGKLVDTTYKQDIFGNQVSSSSNEGSKTYKYNDKGQVESIDTNKGMIKYNYDDNGNVSKKVNEDGRVDFYKYNEFNQLIQLQQGQFTYDYKYDAENERISQTRKDTKDYHFDEWYSYREDLPTISDSQIKNVFENVKKQVSKKQKNGNVCSYIATDSYDVEYFKKPETTTYLVDRTMEFSNVLKSNDTVNIYGETLLQSNNATIVNGWNDSVVAKVTKNNVKKVSHSDYGEVKNINSGQSYNGEMLDQTGLLYLRARYYDPGVARFIQIDKNYDGTKENVASQNKYVYTLNNPYKYVDSSGNSSLSKAVKKTVKKAKEKTKAVVINVRKKIVSSFKQSIAITKNIKTIVNNGAKVLTGFVNGISGKTTNKGGGKISVTKPPKKIKTEAKCPEKAKKTSGLNALLDKVQTIIDYISWIPSPIGDLADGINALIYFMRANFLMGVISIVCLALPAAIMAGAKAIGKACSSAVEFISKISPEARKMVKTVTGFITGIRDCIGKIIWLVGEKVIRPIMAKLDGFAKLIKETFQSAAKKGTGRKTTKDTVKDTVEDVVEDAAKDTVKDTVKGASGANKTPNTDIKTDWYVGPDGTVAPSLKDYDDFIGNGASGAKVKVGEWEYADKAYKGDRLYQDSPNTIKEIINSGPAGTDPRGSNGLWWKADGSFNGSNGFYELLLSPDGKTIWHFVYKSY